MYVFHTQSLGSAGPLLWLSFFSCLLLLLQRPVWSNYNLLPLSHLMALRLGSAHFKSQVPLLLHLAFKFSYSFRKKGVLYLVKTNPFSCVLGRLVSTGILLYQLLLPSRCFCIFNPLSLSPPFSQLYLLNNTFPIPKQIKNKARKP